MRIDSLKILRRSSQTPPPDNRGGLLRLVALGTAFALAIASLGVRLFDLQTRYQAESAQQVTRASVRTRELPALRGLIYDRNGEPIVRNAPLYQIAIVPAELPDRDDTIQRRIDRVAIYNRLAEIIAQPGLTAGDIFTKVLQQSGVAPYRAVVVAENIPRETALYIQELALTMPGVYAQSVGSRYYPYRELLGNILGYTGKVPAGSEEDYERDGYDAGVDRVGLSGMEFLNESDMRGVKGTESVLEDASGEVIQRYGTTPPREGNGVRLTIDLRLQKIISDALVTGMANVKSPRGAVVALDPNTGEVLGMLGIPGFDNNLFTRGNITQKELDDLYSNPHLPLLNKATDDTVPPGSTFKIVTAAALLEEGSVDLNTVIYDPGVFTVESEIDPTNPRASKDFYCWIGLTGGLHGPQRLADALRNSCNTYFRKAVGGYKKEGIAGMGPDKLAEWARTFSIGDPAGRTDLSRVRGFAPTTAWKRATFGDVWTVGDSYNVAIGQGYLIVTPLEMANIIASIANGGTLYKPRLVRDVVDLNGDIVRSFAPEIVRTLPIKPQNMKAIQDALVSVVGPEGTARSVQIPGLTYAGKTGTAEFCDDIAQKTGVCYPGIRVQPSHAWFVAYAPAEKPTIALSVYVWNGGQGSAVAAPIAQRIIAEYFGLPLPKDQQIIKTE
ncbi:MAG TPA: penicillin-binding protein 2 [Thermoflexales bacterium]|nr:penicillin-binding protein 2 [Thermoflexales bacterium]HQX08943.1 penicillin-binding protein 2 [Thermoflexales bacterium]HQY25846.1 penicillin-binding protein 2 [Thermoflexales bacterium]HQZ51883.1 penicillin-binding protein 2 [Thermoflexales bacterium]HRA52068.1 penicillin-binding protein 2 [Thermoflexales bacterium]